MHKRNFLKMLIFSKLYCIINALVVEKYTKNTSKRVIRQKLTTKGMKKSMFVHNYYHNLDSKNRLFIPVRFRDQLGERFYIMPGPKESLFVYPEDKFLQISEEYRAKVTDLDKQMAFFSSVSEHTVDNQGRVTLDARHVKHAALTKEVAVIGAGSRVVLMPLESYKPTENDMASAVDFSVDVGW